ncbi:MAG: hypothetical protein RSD19_08330 [Oscillospiraceae bacterium]
MRESLLGAMCTISDCFNRAGIVYGIGASVMLHYLGLVEDPHDIDILVTPSGFSQGWALAQSRTRAGYTSQSAFINSTFPVKMSI